MEAELFSVFVSSVEVVTETSLVITVPSADEIDVVGTVTILADRVLPLVIRPRLHSTEDPSVVMPFRSPDTGPQPAGTETIFSPAGKRSVTTTSSAAESPTSGTLAERT